MQKDSIKVIVLGCGNRATMLQAAEVGDAYEIVAAVDFRMNVEFMQKIQCPKDMCFKDYKRF